MWILLQLSVSPLNCFESFDDRLRANLSLNNSPRSPEPPYFTHANDAHKSERV